ncbi:DedA family protein [Streptomyces sp. ME02-8801-2C]|uniref:DedA family protein n=1 Tax=Streptomyces sp. ME02-8801-2C TaxID=3028680 RepID=UPI0029ACECE3|nr:DedA family protein [Streptomyces sp. ME02-8801-2C]MDX3457636.1 DedA family protein [Streptomyces sp. ME02-8801-2C]
MDIGALIEAAGWWSYIVVFALTAGETSAFVGVLLPGETVVLLASTIAGRGDLDPVLLAVLVVTGGMTGDSLGYALGHWYGRRPHARLIHRARAGSRIGRAHDFLTRHGGAAVLGGRFIGFVRTFLPFAAGATGMPYRRFFLFSTAASLIWGIGNVLLGYFAGAAATGFLHRAGLIGAVTLVAVGVALFGLGWLVARRRGGARAQSAVVASGAASRRPEQEPIHLVTSSKE